MRDPHDRAEAFSVFGFFFCILLCLLCVLVWFVLFGQVLLYDFLVSGMCFLISCFLL